MKTGKYPEDFATRWETVMQRRPFMRPYPEQYLKYLFDKRSYYLRIYMQVLDEVIQRTGKTPSQITLIDYGCGNGILGLLACFTGFKKVFFQDTDKDFFEAARALSNAMQLKNVEFIPGDINSLLVKEVKADALAATDVIEHIYDLKKFMQHMKMVNPEMVSVFTTAANPFNLISKRKMRALQLKDERKGNMSDNKDLYGMAHPPYLEMRKQIILAAFPHTQYAEQLARATRGLAGNDIIKAVEEFELTNRLPQPAEGTNTCNPITGSFTERILTPHQYHQLFNAAGFTVDLKAGFYDEHSTSRKKFTGKFLNAWVDILGKKISPFLIISGYKKM